MINYKIIFRPICWFTEVYYMLRYNQVISGHDFKAIDDTYNTDLICDICGYISKTKKEK